MPSYLYFQGLVALRNAISIILITLGVLYGVIGAISTGLGIFILVELTPTNGSILMVFSYVFGDLMHPGIFKSAIFMSATGISLIGQSVTTVLVIHKRLHKHLCNYVLLIILCICLELTTGIYAFKFRQEMDLLFERFLFWTIKYKYMGMEEGDNYYTLGWDYVQSEYDCCGVYNGSDWALSTVWQRESQTVTENGTTLHLNLSIPSSCCRLVNRNTVGQHWLEEQVKVLGRTHSIELPLQDQPCLHEPTPHNSYITSGCLLKLSKYILKYDQIVTMGCIVLISTQIAGICLTLLLFRIHRVTEKGWEENNRSPNSTSRNRLSPRSVKKRYAYFDDDFQDQWDTHI